MSAAVWRAAWPVERLRQRAFFTFGMDVLLKLNLQVCAVLSLVFAMMLAHKACTDCFDHLYAKDESAP